MIVVYVVSYLTVATVVFVGVWIGSKVSDGWRPGTKMTESSADSVMLASFVSLLWPISVPLVAVPGIGMLVVHVISRCLEKKEKVHEED